MTRGRKVRYLAADRLSSRSIRSQLAKHRSVRLPCWTDITGRLRGKRAGSPKGYRGTDPARIPDRVSAVVTATTAESRRRTIRRSPTEDYVPIPEGRRASPVRKSAAAKRIPSGSIRERRPTAAQPLRPVSIDYLITRCITNF